MGKLSIGIPILGDTVPTKLADWAPSPYVGHLLKLGPKKVLGPGIARTSRVKNFGQPLETFENKHTILFKIITRMKLLFSNYLGDYNYSFERSFELISIQLQFPCVSSKLQ